ncbi:uroporphyrinogen-III synthase /uroporphyrinogen-III C-methyltransferase [Clostridium sp. CAG:299]|nr:uroporphyrinogen-III synthase /uroporphyrinogen-III C-methyltransferase [Clostridium sp. CAG:299]
MKTEIKKGKVWLVGAGPGDAGLLTLRGREVLEAAQSVVYDALVGDGILEETGSSAGFPKGPVRFMWESGAAPTQRASQRLTRFWWRRLLRAGE